jgi:hypothetical protein
MWKPALLDLNIKIAALAIGACLTQTIPIGEIIGLPLNQVREVHLVVLQVDLPVVDHDPAVEVAEEEETKKILLQAQNFYRV